VEGEEQKKIGLLVMEGGDVVDGFELSEDKGGKVDAEL